QGATGRRREEQGDPQQAHLRPQHALKRIQKVGRQLHHQASVSGGGGALASVKARRCRAAAARSKSVVSSKISPSISTRARFALEAISRSCVTRITVKPSRSFRSRKKSMISRLVRVSRLPVGSSHSRIGG